MNEKTMGISYMVEIPAGTVVHIGGWPVEVVTAVTVKSDPSNIELVTRDLYLRRGASSPTPAPSSDQGA